MSEQVICFNCNWAPEGCNCKDYCERRSAAVKMKNSIVETVRLALNHRGYDCAECSVNQDAIVVHVSARDTGEKSAVVFSGQELRNNAGEPLLWLIEDRIKTALRAF